MLVGHDRREKEQPAQYCPIQLNMLVIHSMVPALKELMVWSFIMQKLVVHLLMPRAVQGTRYQRQKMFFHEVHGLVPQFQTSFTPKEHKALLSASQTSYKDSSSAETETDISQTPPENLSSGLRRRTARLICESNPQHTYIYHTTHLR